MAVALVAVMVTLVVVGTFRGGAKSEGDRIASAALAPYQAFLRREASALCADFTATASARLARTSKVADCAASVAADFASSTAVATLPVLTNSKQLKVGRIIIHGRRATAETQYSGAGGLAHMSLLLENIAAKWRVATIPKITTVHGCLPRGRCSDGRRTLIFTAGVPVVERRTTVSAGSALLRNLHVSKGAFARASMAVVGAGCLACHRIGQSGNAGPGRPLTHVGSRLSERQLARALETKNGVMPSFSRSPQAKRESVIKFLALLR